jgi:4'-phosphopantetheinyl transferase
VAIADGSVGCDLEPPRDLPDLAGMARMVMAPAELADWLPLEGDARVRAFYRAWTRKEALLKARGDGFRADPRGVEVGVGPGAARKVALDDAIWTLRDLRPGASGLAALAVPARPSLVVRTLSLPTALLFQ